MKTIFVEKETVTANVCLVADQRGIGKQPKGGDESGGQVPVQGAVQDQGQEGVAEAVEAAGPEGARRHHAGGRTGVSAAL